jgi:hypothetical protein
MKDCLCDGGIAVRVVLGVRRGLECLIEAFELLPCQLLRRCHQNHIGLVALDHLQARDDSV